MFVDTPDFLSFSGSGRSLVMEDAPSGPVSTILVNSNVSDLVEIPGGPMRLGELRSDAPIGEKLSDLEECLLLSVFRLVGCRQLGRFLSSGCRERAMEQEQEPLAMEPWRKPAAQGVTSHIQETLNQVFHANIRFSGRRDTALWLGRRHHVLARCERTGDHLIAPR